MQLAKKCFHALLGRETKPHRPRRVPKEDKVRQHPGRGCGEPGATVTMKHHGCTSLLVLSRKDKFFMFTNKTAQTKVGSAPHPQQKYAAQQLSNSPSM